MSSEGSSSYVQLVVQEEKDADAGIYMVFQDALDQTDPKQVKSTPVVKTQDDNQGEVEDDEQAGLSWSHLDSSTPPTAGNITVVQIGNHNSTNMKPCQGSPDSGIGSPPGVAENPRLGISSNIPFNKCRFFSGRESDMDFMYELSIHRRLSRNSHQGQVFGLYGVAGGGKSTLAAEFAYKYMDKHYSNGVFWVDASTQDTLHVHFAKIGYLLKLEGLSRSNVHDNIIVVKQWMRDNTEWLCIFDNADHDHVIRTLMADYVLPQHSLHGDVVVTSRSSNTQLLNTDHVREITELSQNDRRSFLIQRTKSLDIYQDEQAMKALDELVQISSGIPLKLEQIGAYIVERNVSFSEYKNIVLAKKFWPYGDVCTGDIKKTITNTYEPNFIAVEAANPDAMKILQCAAFCGTSEIPFEFIHSMWNNMDLSSYQRDFEIKEVLSVARNFSLFRFSPSGKGFIMHQVVQEQLIERTTTIMRKSMATKMLDTLCRIFQTRQCDGKLRRDMLTHAEEFFRKAWITGEQRVECLLPNTPETLMKIGTVMLKSAQTHATLGSFDVAERMIGRVLTEVLSRVDKDSLEGLNLRAEEACQHGLLLLWKGLSDSYHAKEAEKQLAIARQLSIKAEETMIGGALNYTVCDIINMKIKRAEISKWLVCVMVECWSRFNVQEYIEEARDLLESINREECNSGQIHQIKRHHAHLECQNGKFFKLKALEVPLRHESSSSCDIEYLEKAQMHYERAVSHCPLNDNRLPVYKGQLEEIRLRVEIAKNLLEPEKIQTALSCLKICLQELNIVGRWSRYAGFLHKKIAWVLSLKGEYRGALREIDQSIAIMQVVFQCQSDYMHCKFGNNFHLKGNILRSLGWYEEACFFLEKASRIYRSKASNPKYRICMQDLQSCREQEENLQCDTFDSNCYY